MLLSVGSAVRKNQWVQLDDQGKKKLVFNWKSTLGFSSDSILVLCLATSAFYTDPQSINSLLQTSKNAKQQSIAPAFGETESPSCYYRRNSLSTLPSGN